MSQAVDETDGAASLLHRPDYAPPGGTTLMMMQPHIPDVGTGAYDDVEKCLAMIHKVKVEGKGLRTEGDNWGPLNYELVRVQYSR